LAGADRLQEISEPVNKSVFVANLQPGRPPALHIGVVTVGHVDAAPAARQPFIAVIEVQNAIQVVQIPKGRSALAVDFERVERLLIGQFFIL
jgi:hypothetical protein